MEIAFKKHLFKKPHNGKSCGCIDFYAKCDNKPAHIAGSILGEYDYISAIDEERVKQAFESIFKDETHEKKRLTNKEWIDFLVDQFDISRTSAREMLHGMMWMKGEDNFKKRYNRRVTECHEESHPNN